MYRDQLDRTVVLPSLPPKRIVSLVPSQTELLAYLGLNEQVLGLTKFCVHPPSWRKQKTIIGGTKVLNLDGIANLQPDLVIANQEENDREQVLALAERFPVWVSRVADLSSALDMIQCIGDITATEETAKNLSEQIRLNFDALPTFETLGAVYLIWRKPYMAGGGDTFIHQMMKAAGFENLLGEAERYPELSAEALAQLNPEVILLSSEPYPFKEKHIAELSAICPKARIRLVDGEMFSWYGSRLLWAPAYFRKLRASL